MKEIGSEYHYEKLSKKGNKTWQGIVDMQDETFVFSGRTAIETVLLNLPHIRKAILPSYCCDSMIEPFRKAGINFIFYEVNFHNGLDIQVDIPEDIDLLLWCNYFGFRVKMPDFTDFIDRGGIILEDITHSFFSQNVYNSQSQYVVASLRKWGPLLCGGYCATKGEYLKYKPTLLPLQEFLEQKKRAMRLKYNYIYEIEDIDKNIFLNDFSESNKWIAKNYSQLAIDEETKNIFTKLDWQEVSEVRKRNAKVLYTGLKDISSIKFLYKEKDMDCPLFVPILVESGMRNSLRRTLTENSIYCPIHWPKPSESCVSNLYEMELSLICDQRYDENDMKRIVEVISRWDDTKIEVKEKNINE